MAARLTKHGLASGPMIVWINGTHGAGKATTSALVQKLIPDSRVFDAEKVGETLMDITPGLPNTDNFQHWPPWRQLVIETARSVLDYTGGTLVMPMTILVEQYWREINTGLAHHAIPVRHFVLHADQSTLRGRIEGNTSSPPRSASSTSSPTPRQLACGYIARPRSSTPRTSRPPKPLSRSQKPSRGEARLSREQRCRWQAQPARQLSTADSPTNVRSHRVLHTAAGYASQPPGHGPPKSPPRSTGSRPSPHPADQLSRHPTNRRTPGDRARRRKGHL